jgi:hypothetical protein
MKRLGFRELHGVTRALIVLALVDFLVFAILTVAIGGDAGDGAVRDGRFFVANHGVEREVGAATWWVSRVLGLSLYILWPAAILAFAIDSFRPRDEPERTSLLGRDNAAPRRRK